MPNERKSKNIEQLELEIAYYKKLLEKIAAENFKLDSTLSNTKRQLKQKTDGYHFIVDLLFSIGQLFDNPQIIHNTLTMLCGKLQFDKSAYFKFKSDSDHFILEQSFGFSEDELQTAKEISITTDFVKSPSYLLVNKKTRETELIQMLREKTKMPSFFCVPVKSGDDLYGLLWAGRMKESKPFHLPFDDKDLETFHVIAGFLATRLNNTSLFEEIKEMAHSFERFVPKQFLEILGYVSIVDARIGDQIQQDMTILFTDIRDFTTISESLSPQDNCNLINDVLSVLEPIIDKYNGFIDKYIGDAIMALFPDKPDDALKAANEMNQAMIQYNKNSNKKYIRKIEVGVGINSGKCVLCTVGNPRRMDSTVISDAVNLTSRVESLTRYYGVHALVSSDTVNILANPKDFQMRYLDKVVVKGRTQYIELYELLDAYDGDKKQNLINILPDYQAAIKHYYRKDFGKAKHYFNKVLKIIPSDQPSKIMIARIEEYEKKGIPDDWDGAYILSHK